MPTEVASRHIILSCLPPQFPWLVVAVLHVARTSPLDFTFPSLDSLSPRISDFPLEGPGADAAADLVEEYLRKFGVRISRIHPS